MHHLKKATCKFDSQNAMCVCNWKHTGKIQYKLAVLAFRHFEGTLPTYLSAMLCMYEPARSLRSSTGDY